jgi:Family of unknown function (DUF6328)
MYWRAMPSNESARLHVGEPARSPGEPLDTDAADSDLRQESAAERDDRNLAELLQELRVISIGVQVLFGALLSLPFTTRFDRLDGVQRDLYLASLVLAAVATTLLLSPVAYHRVVFRRGLKEGLVRFANVMALVGLAAVGGAILTAVAMVIDYVDGTLPAIVVTGVVAVLLVTLWFAVPVARRRARR